jgi:hypothetical protein
LNGNGTIILRPSQVLGDQVVIALYPNLSKDNKRLAWTCSTNLLKFDVLQVCEYASDLEFKVVKGIEK